MKRLGCLLFCVGLFVFLWGSEVRAATPPERVPVVAVFPPVVVGVEKPAEQQHLALLMQAHAVEYLVATNRYSDLHIKQILRMIEHEGRNPSALASHDEAWQVAGRLGADRVVYGQLTYESDGWRLEIKAASLDSPKPHEVAAPAKHLPRLLREAIVEGGRYMADQIAKLDGVQLPESLAGGVTATRSPEALAAFGRCYAGLINQSFRIDSPVMLSKEELASVENSCTEAAKKDPTWKSAEAAKLLVLALRASQDPQKNQELFVQVANQVSSWDSVQSYEPFFFLAAYWLATCFISADNGVAVLDEALKIYPHSLIFHSYRGRHLLWSGRYKEAEAAWRTYLTLHPNSAYVRGGLSHALSLNDKRAEAIEVAKLAYDHDRGDHEALVELASRYIDSEKYQEAIDLMLPLSQAGQGKPNSLLARGDVFLRLGYAYLKKQPPSLPDAERALRQAIAAAKGPAEWKLRARAHLDLADLYKQSNKPDQAAQELQLASGEKGARLYVLRKLDGQSLAQIASARKTGSQTADVSVATLPRKPDKGSGVKISVCLIGACLGSRLAALTTTSGAIDRNGFAAQSSPNENSFRDVGTNRVEVGGAPHPYSGSGFLISP